MSKVYGQKSKRSVKRLENYKHYHKCNRPVTVFLSQDNSFTSYNLQILELLSVKVIIQEIRSK